MITDHYVQYDTYEYNKGGNLVLVHHKEWVSDEKCREWAKRGKWIRGYNLP